jgi:hypothetical protein
LLLTYAYTGRTRWDSLGAFLKIMAAEYGPAIPCAPLRHAVVASAAHALPSEHFGRIKEHHAMEGWKALCVKIISDTPLNPTEVFATSILADIAWDSSPSSPEALAVVQIGRSVLSRGSEGSGNRPLSTMLNLFGPYFRDGLRYCEMTALTLTAKNSEWFIPQRADFNECRRYYQEFQRIQSNGRTGAEDAVFDTLQEIMHALVCCLHRRSSKEQTPETMRILGAATRNILSEFNNAELHQCISRITDSNPIFSTPTDKWALECHPGTFIAVLLKGIEILFALLESRSTLDGIFNGNIKAMAKTLISTIRLSLPGNNPLRNWMTYGASVLLGGMVLCNEDDEERK